MGNIIQNAIFHCKETITVELDYNKTQLKIFITMMD